MIFVHDARQIFVCGRFASEGGYARLTVEVVKQFLRLGVNVKINDRCNVTDYCPPAFRTLEAPRHPLQWNLFIYPPSQLLEGPMMRAGEGMAVGGPGVDKRTVVFTMWESTKLPSEIADVLNRAALVIVPSEWGVKSFRASGVTVPIVKVPLGYDDGIYFPKGDPPKVCTFGTAGMTMGGGFRKNIAGVISLFQAAFPTEDVRLKVKMGSYCELPLTSRQVLDERIEVARDFISDVEMADWYRSLSCYVNGSFSEGFGIQPLEAMGCGVPVIGTHYSGVAEYFDASAGQVVPHFEAGGAGIYCHGEWGEYLHGNMIAAMRRFYHGRGIVNRPAERARQFSWARTGERLVWQLRKAGLPI